VAVFLSGCGGEGNNNKPSTTTKAPPGPAPPPPGGPVSDCDSPLVHGVLRYYMDGEAMDAFVLKATSFQCTSGNCVQISDAGLTLSFGQRADQHQTSRVHFSDRCPPVGSTLEMEVDHLLKWNMIGKSIRYDMDVSQMGCRCMAGLSFLGMPNPTSQCPLKYCDAIQGQGCDANCMQMDLFAGNNEYMKTSVKASKAGGGPALCGKVPTYRSFGPHRKIDTTGKFNFVTSFCNDTSESSISRIEMDLTSGGSTETFFQTMTEETEFCNASTAIRDVSHQMNATGMVLSIVSDSWLEDASDGCLGNDKHCNLAGFSISNMQIFSAHDLCKFERNFAVSVV